MPWRILPTIILAFLLIGCAADQRQIEICRQALDALVEDAGDVAPLGVEHEGTVRFGFTRTAEPGSHQITCHFAGGALSPDHLDLMLVEEDGAALSEIRMILLRHLLGLPTPARLLALPAPELPPAAHAAYFTQQLFNGLALGAIFALIAVGYSLVYGITGTIQFAYGEVFMIGAFLFLNTVFVLGVLGVHDLVPILVFAFALAAAMTALNGWATMQLVYRPLLRSGRLNTLIGAIGLSIAIREAIRLTQGTRYRWLPPMRHGSFVVFDGGGFSVYLAESQIAILLVAVLATAVLAYLMLRTRWGHAHRACADDPVMAGLLGVDIWGTVGRSFTLGAALAALAGTAFTIQYGEADFFMGYFMGFKALTAALLGGFGTVTGALVGGLLLGLFESFWAGYLSSAYKDAAVFGVLALVLIFRPSGLLGHSIGGTNMFPAEPDFVGRDRR